MADSAQSANASAHGHSHHEHKPFPAWLQQLLGVGAVIAAVTTSHITQREQSQQTAVHVEQQSKQIEALFGEIRAVQAALPNREVYDMKWEQLHARIVELEEGSKVRVMLDQRLREQLIKKGVLD